MSGRLPPEAYSEAYSGVAVPAGTRGHPRAPAVISFLIRRTRETPARRPLALASPLWSLLAGLFKMESTTAASKRSSFSDAHTRKECTVKLPQEVQERASNSRNLCVIIFSSNMSLFGRYSAETVLFMVHRVVQTLRDATLAKTPWIMCPFFAARLLGLP